MAFNLPNQLTAGRLVLSLVLFVFVVWQQYVWALLFFILAAITDWMDGWYARKYDQVTTLGRILDPLADKVIICGTLILLSATPEMTAVPWGLRPWMVVVIVGRELLVTTLRSFIERQGMDFSARASGKVKMVLQCIAAGVCLFYLAREAFPLSIPWLGWAVAAAVWLAVLATVYSGAVYVAAAVRLLRGQ
jgi:CDP-diacylglycerol--glycerol-3-phosphate 3-phosphatidyltransferase